MVDGAKETIRERERSGNEPSPEEHQSRFFLLAMSSAAFLCCVALAIVGQLLTGVPSLAGFTSSDLFEPRMWGAGVLLTLPMFVMLYLERCSRFAWLRALWDLSSEVLGPIVSKVTFAELAVVALFAGIGEELLFRGFLQNWLAGYGVFEALILPNVLFGILHWISPGYAACTFCIGLYFSCMLHFANSVNLVALMIAHSLYDLVALLCLAREVRRRTAGD
ncbi:MAG: CPBP family intramembrane metalloprotease [Rhodopirellula sp.]|nr:CPBP family intramembrane metalloprotease [Rhodopirellula sp.]